MVQSRIFKGPRIKTSRKAAIAVKKRHTVKSILISNPRKEILYLSKPYVGKAHDFGILKQEFAPRKNWFRPYKVQLDLGFYGFKELYKCKELEIPHKRPKNKDLDEQRKVENKSLASSRVKVEHAFGGLKRYRILTDRLRCKNINTYSEMLGICAGL